MLKTQLQAELFMVHWVANFAVSAPRLTRHRPRRPHLSHRLLPTAFEVAASAGQTGPFMGGKKDQTVAVGLGIAFYIYGCFYSSGCDNTRSSLASTGLRPRRPWPQGTTRSFVSNLNAGNTSPSTAGCAKEGQQLPAGATLVNALWPQAEHSHRHLYRNTLERSTKLRIK